MFSEAYSAASMVADAIDGQRSADVYSRILQRRRERKLEAQQAFAQQSFTLLDVINRYNEMVHQYNALLEDRQKELDLANEWVAYAGRQKAARDRALNQVDDLRRELERETNVARRFAAQTSQQETRIRFLEYDVARLQERLAERSATSVP